MVPTFKVDTSKPYQFINFNDLSPWKSLTIDLDEVFVVYTNTHLLNGEGAHPSAMHVERKLADQCFLALATTYFAHDHHEKGLFERGLTRYGSALSNLHSALSDPRRHSSYEILESVILMTLFETLMSNKKDGWIAHSLGMQRLFELRGPETFQRNPERNMFEIARPTIIYASLVMRQRTILSQRRWKDVPWANDPKEKLLYHYVVDILADCPDLICIKDRALLLEDTEVRLKAMKVFITAARSKLDELRAWKATWDAKEPSCCMEISPTSDPPLCQNRNGEVPIKAWKTEYSFKSIYHCVTIAIYHSLRIHLHRMMKGHDAEADAITLQTAESETFTSGIEICRIVSYHMEMARKGEGSFAFMFPLRMAWEAVHEQEPNVGKWLQNILAEIATGPTGRWAVAGYLLNQDEIPTGPRRRPIMNS